MYHQNQRWLFMRMQIMSILKQFYLPIQIELSIWEGKILWMVPKLISFNTTEECATACIQFNSPNGQQCHSFTYHTPEFNSSFSKQCFAVIDYAWGYVLSTTN